MKKILSVFIFLFAVTVGIAGYFTVKYSGSLVSSYYLGKASAAYKQQMTSKAAYFYEEAIRKNPENSAARVACASLLLEMGNAGQAETQLLQCIKITPDNPDGYIKLSSIYVASGRIYDAVNLLNNIQSDYAKTKIGALRPKTPTLSPAPGRYTSQTEVSINFDADTECYFSINEQIPSFSSKSDGTVSIKSGSNEICAVSVSSDGIVSDICHGSYQIDDYTVTVGFKDKTVEQMVRAALSRYTGHITVGDLKNIRSLSNRTSDGQKIGAEITTFSDFQYFKSLEELSLYNLGQLPDITGLSVLPDLKSLSLVNCGLTNDAVSPLTSIKSLAVLDISDNRLSRLDDVCTLENLSGLSVKNNFVGDLTPLLLCQKLNYLDISGNPISNASSIGLLTGLNQLNLSNCNLNDISFVKTLKNLSYLNISQNKIKDIDPLSNCTSLETLIAGNNFISGISSLSNMPALAVLDIRSNSVTTLRPLSMLTSIQTINISNNKISDLSPLERCTKLKAVFAQGNPIDDASLYAFGNVSMYLD